MQDCQAGDERGALKASVRQRRPATSSLPLPRVDGQVKGYRWSRVKEGIVKENIMYCCKLLPLVTEVEYARSDHARGGRGFIKGLALIGGQ